MDLAVLISSAVSFVLYLNSLDADFAYDDSRAIKKNQDLLPETPLINLFYDDFWGTPLTHSGSHKSYRPLCVLSFRLNYYLGEFSPWGYHLGNILLHVIVTAVFTKLARIFLRDDFPTFAAGLLFAAHPVHTEAVAGIVGRADVGACLFFLLSLLCYIQYVKYREHVTESGPPFWGLMYIVGTAIFTTASMLTKEQGVTVIAVCATYDLFVHNKVQIADILSFRWLGNRKIREGILYLAVIGILLVAFRIMFMGNKPPEFAPSDNPAADSDSIVTRFLTYILLPVYNMWILLCPRVLSFDWSMDAIPLVESIGDIRNVFSIVFYAILFYVSSNLLTYLHKTSQFSSQTSPLVKPHLNGNGVSHHGNHSSQKNSHNGKRHKHSRRGSNSSTGSEEDPVEGGSTIYKSQDILIISLSLMVFPFIPATNLFFYVGFVIAERVLYIPSMGFCLLVAHGANSLYKKYKSDEVKKKCILGSVGLLLLMLSGRTFLRNRVWQSEENLYSSGLSTNPAKAWGNLANVWNQQGKKMEAEQAYRNALKHRGNMADTHYNLGILLQDQKRMEAAVESYKRAIQYRPKLSMAHLNLAIIYAGQGKYAEAEKIYRHCADLDTSGLKDPRLHENTKISALYNLGRMLAEQERNKEAIEVYREALKRRPSYYAPQSIYNMLGEVYMKIGQIDEAEKWYKEALKAKADHVPAHLTMAKLLHKKNQIKEAEQWFKKAKQLDPDDTMVDHHYAQFLGETGRLKESSTMYRQAIQKSPNDFELIFNAANILRQDGDNEASEKLYEKAVLLKPNVATAHMNLGAMYHLNGKLEKAEQSYLEALKLKPTDITTQQNLQKLRNLMQSNGRQRQTGKR
ncbi:protein O-mannosyl-transferase TMTC2-like [Saccostrea echinata]|uniref:protein O-mannosyl-transferase TMTC2-like n=1 Tax=Saccostrea echinata TaxID=191078 RepID=UPI002A81983E|nr:protein O-mannosyl-transferase TMTC2-like [Saccostrea echinata]